MAHKTSFSIAVGIVWTLTVAILSMTPSITSAQRTNMYIDGDSSIVLEKVYAGVLTGPIYDFPSKKILKPVDVRGGIAARWDISKTFAIRSFGFADYEMTSATGFGNAAFWAEYKPTKHWKISLGQGPSLTASNHRPHPATDLGHFETFTTALLPGVMSNMTISFTPRNTTYATTVGIYQQQPAYMVGFSSKKWIGTGYYTQSSHRVGGALTYNGKKIQNTLVYSHDGILANIFGYDCGKNISFYADEGFHSITKRMVRSEQGFLRVWSGKPAKGLFGLGYDAVNKQVKSYLFVTL